MSEQLPHAVALDALGFPLYSPGQMLAYRAEGEAEMRDILRDVTEALILRLGTNADEWELVERARKLTGDA